MLRSFESGHRWPHCSWTAWNQSYIKQLTQVTWHETSWNSLWYEHSGVGARLARILCQRKTLHPEAAVYTPHGIQMNWFDREIMSSGLHTSVSERIWRHVNKHVVILYKTYKRFLNDFEDLGLICQSDRSYKVIYNSLSEGDLLVPYQIIP